MSRTLVVSLVASVVAALLAVAPAAGAATSRLTFGISPTPLGSAIAAPDFTFGVTEGASVADSVEIFNYSASPLTLGVYAADAVQVPSGGFGLLLPTQKSVGVGAWVHFGRAHESVTLAPAGADGPTHSVLPFVLHVPDNASPGDHVGAILASLRVVGTDKSGKRIVLDQRVGVRLYVTVAGATRTGLRIMNLHASVSGGLEPWQHDVLHVSYQVENTGNVNVSLDQRVSASGPIADHASTTSKVNPIVLPGAVLSESATIPGLWPQFVTHVVVRATGSLVTVQGLRQRLSASASTWVLTVPWLGVLLVLILIALAWWELRRRRASAVAATEPTDGSAA